MKVNVLMVATEMTTTKERSRGSVEIMTSTEMMIEMKMMILSLVGMEMKMKKSE